MRGNSLGERHRCQAYTVDKSKPEMFSVCQHKIGFNREPSTWVVTRILSFSLVQSPFLCPTIADDSALEAAFGFP